MPAPGGGGLPVRRTYTRWILKEVPAGLALADADTPPLPVGAANGSPPKKKLASMQEHRRPVLDDFEAVVSPIPSEADLLKDEVLVRNTCLSVDAYTTAFDMEDRNVGQTVPAGSAGIVIASKSDDFMQGDTVVGPGGAAEYSVLPAKKWRRVSPDSDADVEYDPAEVGLSPSLGVLGVSGVTAYLAVRDLFGKPPWPLDQTVVVTGAAGSVGSCAGQLCKLWGADKVIGICGSDEKCVTVTHKYGFDACLNYNIELAAAPNLAADTPPAPPPASAAAAENSDEDEVDKGSDDDDDEEEEPASSLKPPEDLAGQLALLCGDSPVDCFFDCTGGPAASIVKAAMVDGGKVAKVGSLGGPDTSEHDHRLVIKGFYAAGLMDRWPDAIRALAELIEADEIQFDETVLDGIGTFPEAMVGMMEGAYEGKTIVKL